MGFCEHKHKKKNRLTGQSFKGSCSKQSTNYTEYGKALCRKHFNKWFEKKHGITYNMYLIKQGEICDNCIKI